MTPKLYGELRSGMIGRRILILSPHPDDEVVGAAAAILRAGAAGVSVFVLHLTTGIPAQDVLWPWDRRGHARRVAHRRAEAFQAANALGVEIVGCCDRPSRTLWTDLPGARRDVVAVVARLSIDRLWVPAYEGGHSDHDAANGLASTFRNTAEVWEFAEYNFCGGRITANAFPDRRGSEVDLALTPEEAGRKSDLLRLYASEQGNLAHAGVTRECFRPLADHDYGQPPHPGPLFYQRYHWLWFRHPRVDFTTTPEVCAAVTALRAVYANAPTPDPMPAPGGRSPAPEPRAPDPASA